MSSLIGRVMGHRRLRTQCGICGKALSAGVSFVTLLGDGLEPESGICLDRALFPPDSRCIINGDKFICWSPSCRQCPNAAEAVGLHSTCLNMFQEHCKTDKAVDRLWITIGKRNLWQRAPMLHLDRETALDIEIVREKAEAYGMRSLKLLPVELIHMVQEYSDSATFWRYIHVLSTARELSRLKPDTAPPATSIPLCNILSWTRGDYAAVLSSNCPPVVRLTLDHRGIRKIERLSKSPYKPGRSDKEAFVIAPATCLQDVVAVLEFQMLRLELPASLLGLHIWDTPNPPGIEDCDFYGRVTPSMQFKTTNLRSVTGLTPYATKTFGRLPAKRQESIVWIYLPVPRDEEITAITMRLKVDGGAAIAQKPFFMIRTKLAGDVYVGPCHLRQHRDIVLGQSSPELLIHNVADVGPATVFGTYPRRQHHDSLPPFSNRWPNMAPRLPLTFERMYLSVASLKDVTGIQVLEDGNFECKGMIFDYGNGAQRALGDCKFGHYRVKTYLRPRRLCYCHVQPTPAIARGVHIEIGSESDHAHSGDDWKCSKMEGNIEFWFSKEHSVIVCHSVENTASP
ncbi:uncharacterized protein FTJAE_8773 [Fusarium tjaetaba]|uniref:Uncharacterized protein n=1 Tax=Fusarium tjaetaba TaxID=1567544 RepID=A0A8H5VNI0_9HYPO|nr:uncharacterized protein FTJAE_8773 [Fusarium tjaetaba]KAF5628683.1 hypothetical protein FTJAE_8773 [Fusarium tjaetaba]